jgi:myo-inositol-1(or 4)-monophosphatase
MLELLEQLFRQVRSYAQAERYDLKQVYAKSPKRVTMQFDRDAEDIIINGLTESGIGFEIITEERPTFSTAEIPPYRIVIDPIDGSTNFERGIRTAAVALAVLPINLPVLPENVQWALVGELFSGTVYEAQRGGGAFLNGRRCQTSTSSSLHDCLFGLNLDGCDIHTLKALLMEEPTLGTIRRTGSPAIDSVYVASNSYDAYIDIGNTLTGESFLASASIVLEAGGVISDYKGNPLCPITSLTQKFSLVMASNKKLHHEIIQKLNKM